MIKYQEAIDTIIWSLPFKRLGGKTQVFVKGIQDHHRDRLTHTIEVMNLSEKLADEINKKNKKKKKKKIDIDLCKAIALAHDLGHTPFGHAGEEALHIALSNIIILGCNNIKGLQGFNHYEQGLDVVSYMYSKDTTNSGKGLFKKNVNKEICKGILQHTYFINGCKSKENAGLNYLIKNTKYIKIITKKAKNPSTEAQIVRICDKIAFMISDLEDGFIVNAISISDLKKISHNSHNNLFKQLKKENFDFSEHRSFLRCREKIIKRLIQGCEISDDKIKCKQSEVMDEVYKDIQEGIIFKNYYVKNGTEKGKLIVSCLFCQYLRNPELIGFQSFRYKYHDQSQSFDCKEVSSKISFYSKLEGHYNFSNNQEVQIYLSKWFKINNCSGTNVEQDFKRNIVDVICAKDWVASLTDRYAEECYHEHVNCWKSKEKWKRLNSTENIN